MANRNRRRSRALLSALLVLAAGLCAKLYPGPGAGWANNSLAGAFYVIFWCLAGFFLIPRARPAAVALTVLATTCALEFLQLWHPPVLESVRATFVGHALIGSAFAWSDFPYYALGGAAGWFWLRALGRPSPTP